MAQTNKKNIDLVISELIKAGIKNPYSIAGALSIIAKESGFIPQSEIAYNKTSNTRIKEIFSKTRNLTDAQLTVLKSDPVKFFDFVYGGLYGNAPNEGYKYRGRGFNQITFKANYKKFGDSIGVDLVKNPDLLNDPKIAARAVAAYFLTIFAKYPQIIKARYGANNINDFSDLNTAVEAFYNANAGIGKDTSKSVTKGKTEAKNKVSDIYQATNEFLNTPGGKGLLIGLASAVLLFLAIKN